MTPTKAHLIGAPSYNKRFANLLRGRVRTGGRERVDASGRTATGAITFARRSTPVVVVVEGVDWHNLVLDFFTIVREHQGVGAIREPRSAGWLNSGTVAFEEVASFAIRYRGVIADTDVSDLASRCHGTPTVVVGDETSVSAVGITFDADPRRFRAVAPVSRCVVSVEHAS